MSEIFFTGDEEPNVPAGSTLLFGDEGQDYLEKRADGWYHCWPHEPELDSRWVWPDPSNGPYFLKEQV